MGGGGLVCAAVWLAVGQEAPTAWRRKDTGAIISASEHQGGGGGGGGIGGAAARKTNWKLFRHPAVLSVLWCKVRAAVRTHKVVAATLHVPLMPTPAESSSTKSLVGPQMAEGNFFYTTGQW